MRQFTLATGGCLVALLTAFVSVDVAAKDKFVPPPGCRQRWSEIAELEASLKGERKVPFDRKANTVKPCNLMEPLPTKEVRTSLKPSVAVVVFDVTGSGRVVGQQLIAGKGTPWGDLVQQHVARWVFEPVVDDGIGITRVGVSVSAIVEWRGQKCGKVQAPAKPDFETRLCLS